jgi:hypothetical protein
MSPPERPAASRKPGLGIGEAIDLNVAPFGPISM